MATATTVIETRGSDATAVASTPSIEAMRITTTAAVSFDIAA